MDLSNKELENLITNAVQEGAKIGAMTVLTEMGTIKPTISKAEAYRTYGRFTVDRWITEGLVIPIKDGPSSHKIRINRVQIQIVNNSANRVSWFKNNASV